MSNSLFPANKQKEWGTLDIGLFPTGFIAITIGHLPKESLNLVNKSLIGNARLLKRCRLESAFKINLKPSNLLLQKPQY